MSRPHDILNTPISAPYLANLAGPCPNLVGGGRAGHATDEDVRAVRWEGEWVNMTLRRTLRACRRLLRRGLLYRGRLIGVRTVIVSRLDLHGGGVLARFETVKPDSKYGGGRVNSMHDNETSHGPREWFLLS